MNDAFEFSTFIPCEAPKERRRVQLLLASCGLDCDEGIQVFLVCHQQGRLVACAGLDGNIVKCVAISQQLQGTQFCLQLMNEVANLAMERGHAHLFLYTKPERRECFEDCAFHTLVEIPGQACLMENTPVGVKKHVEQLSRLRSPGQRIGSIVMNANPFTLGHQHLVRSAAEDCDVLHLFVVSEDASFFSYRDRMALVQAGVADIPKVQVHAGSEYMVSKATFPTYFLKDQGLIENCRTGIDLLLFRNYIAPALGITHRYVGTEPFCPLTRQYNEDMRYWLGAPISGQPAIQVVERARIRHQGLAISASEVRRRLITGDFSTIAKLVPVTTLELLQAKFSVPTAASA